MNNKKKSVMEHNLGPRTPDPVTELLFADCIRNLRNAHVRGAALNLVRRPHTEYYFVQFDFYIERLAQADERYIVFELPIDRAEYVCDRLRVNYSIRIPEGKFILFPL